MYPFKYMRRVILVLACCLLLVPGCSRESSEKAEGVKRPPLKVAWILWTGWYPMAIAKELKLFEKHGANIEPILYENYPQTFPDFAAGKIDGNFGGLYEYLKANIPDTKIVMATDYSDGAEGLVVTSDIKSAKDLVGKRIGIQGALSGSEFVITTLLRKNDIKPSSLTMVDVSPETVLNEMPHGIQGGYTWDPHLSRAVEKGYRVLFTTADLPGMIPDVLAFRGSVVRERPDEIRGFIKAWFEALEFWKTRPDEAAGIIARVTAQKPGDITLKGCRILDKEDNIRAFTDSNGTESLFYTGRKQIEFFIGLGDASKVPDLKKILDSTYLK